MHISRLQLRSLILTTVVCLTGSLLLVAEDQPAPQPTLTKEQIRTFLLTAKVIASKQTEKGITQPSRLTLTDGTVTHDASFQPVDEHKMSMTMANGRTELNFVDSYKYNIAAYLLAEMVGFDDMMPVYVERKWKGTPGSLSWWLPVKMDEGDRLKRKLEVPDPDAWNKQMYKVRVFDQLVYDSDPNLTNVLIGEDWKIYRIDFSRAFRTTKDLQSTKDLSQCDHQMFEKLKALDGNELLQKTKGYLNKSEVNAVMARRDKIVEVFQKEIAEKGESGVLY